MAGDVDGSPGDTITTPKGSTDQAASGASGVGNPVHVAPGDLSPADAGDDSAGGEKPDEHADADQGAE